MRNFRSRIVDKKETLSDRELFTSHSCEEFFNTMIEGVTSLYGRVIKLFIKEEQNNDVACCYPHGNGFGLDININNVFMNGKDRETKFRMMKGLVLHECGHILFTDFKMCKQNVDAMNKNDLFPQPNNKRYEEYRQYVIMNNCTKQIISLWLSFDNILEDAFIERLLIALFHGYGQSLVLLRKEHYDTMETYEEMVDKGLKEWIIALNLLLCYAKFGKVKCNISNSKSKAVKFLLDNMETIESILTSDNAYIRQMMKNNLFIDYVLFIKEVQEDEKQDNSQQGSDSSQQGNSQQDGSQQSDGSQQGNSQQDSSQQENLSESLEKALNNLSQSLNSMPTSNNSAMANTNSVMPTSNQTGSFQNNNSSPTPIFESNGNDEVADGKTDPALEKLLNDTATEKVQEEVEEELTLEKLQAIKDVPYGKFHLRTTSNYNRAIITERNKIAYDIASERLLPISKKLQGNLKKELKDMREGGKETGLLSGRKLNTSALYRYDRKVMMKNIRPIDVPDMAVCLLVDESGSMSGNKIDCARDTAFIVYDFCTALKIPVAIYGHTSTHNHVDIYSYAEFNSVDGKDKYRIMDMQARNCNRDGYALRFAVSQLEKQPCDVKLMMIISDGSPNSYNYGQSEGKADIQQLLKEKSPKGINFITAGLGSDMHLIKRIYTEGLSERISAKFLEIDKLETLPKTFVNIIKRFLKK